MLLKLLEQRQNLRLTVTAPTQTSLRQPTFHGQRSLPRSHLYAMNQEVPDEQNKMDRTIPACSLCRINRRTQGARS
jgi:hypothetical protein